ncbi:hypothetical protein L3V83_12760, partial [Thiotrichales bacterium 19X7-9]|nr:hypothetical protein [Thiotrichales bacterium 19X7-9]
MVHLIIDAVNHTDTVTISDNDSGLNAVTVVANDAIATETPTDNAQFTIDLGGINGTGSDVTVNYSITGTAANGVDYATITGSVVIADGAQSATVDILGIADDAFIEGSETVILTLTGTSSALFTVDAANNTDTVTIIDNDSGLDAVTITANDPNASETPVNDGQFTVDLGGINGTGGNVTVNFTVSGTATNGTDYAAIGGSVTIADGQSSATIDVASILDDNLIEGAETVIITLNSVDNALFSIDTNNDHATVTIA